MKAGDWPTYGRDSSRANRAVAPVTPPLTSVWSVDVTGGIGSGSPVVIDSLVIVGTLRGEIYVIDARTGERKGWIGLCDEINGSPAADGNVIYVAGSGEGEWLVAFDISAGRTIWKKTYGEFEVSPLLSGNRLYLGNLGGVFHCVDAENGEGLWKYETPDNKKWKGIRSTAALGEGRVLFGSD